MSGKKASEILIQKEKYEGRIFYTNKSEEFVIIKYIDSRNVHVEFVNTGFTATVRMSAIRTGRLLDPLCRRYFNRGFLGRGKYNSKSKMYMVWCCMLKRCYDIEFQNHNKSYIGCLVCDEWHNYQNFARWFDDNYVKDFALDKDLLSNSKLYSPETCVLIPQQLNSAIIINNTKSSNLPTGVRETNGGKFVCNITRYGNLTYLGTYQTPLIAHAVYASEKKKYICELAEKYKSSISEKIYNALLNFKVE